MGASGLSTQYNTAELKSEYAQLLASMTASDGKHVDLALVPTYVGDFLKSHLSVYYNANVEFEEEEEETVESDEENMVQKENLVPLLKVKCSTSNLTSRVTKTQNQKVR